MATEKRLIDANEAYEIARASGRHNDFARSRADLTSLQEVFEDCTTVDAVEVVRCKDCCNCTKSMWCNLLMMGTRKDNFCSYGERRTNV